jgi:hypothetical protein
VLIKSYGLFWQLDEVDWHPGIGTKGGFRLLGRHGERLPKLRLANFRFQKGIYILYDNHGAHYVGLTMGEGLGKRLKDHLHDIHEGLWNRFSWFGFCSVLSRTGQDNIHKLGKMAVNTNVNPASIIKDTEALLIRAMGLRNINTMRFSEKKAVEWTQVKKLEVDHYLSHIA